MPLVSEGLTGPGIEPQPEEKTLDDDETFRRALEAKPGGADLIHSQNEWGAPSSEHRRAKIASYSAELEETSRARAKSKEDLHDYVTAPNEGDWRSGIEVPDDSPPAPAPVVDTAEVERLQRELTVARDSLTEAQEFEATDALYDELEDVESDEDVHTALSQYRETVGPEAWSQFALDAVGGGVLDPEELTQHETLYESEQAFEQAQGQAQKSQEEADALEAAQRKALESELDRLSITDREGQAVHLLDMATAASQLGIDPTELPIEEYTEKIRWLSAFAAEGRHAYKHKAIRESIMNATSSGSVEDGLTLPGGIPVNPPVEIEAEIDWKRLAARENLKRVDIAKEVMKEDAKSRSLGEEADAVFRQAVRASEAKQARARRSGF